MRKLTTVLLLLAISEQAIAQQAPIYYSAAFKSPNLAAEALDAYNAGIAGTINAQQKVMNFQLQKQRQQIQLLQQQIQLQHLQLQQQQMQRSQYSKF